MGAEASRPWIAVCLALCSWVVAATVHATAPEGEQLTLEVGEQQVLSSKGVVSFSEGIEGVVDVRLTPEGERFVVVGLKPGETTLLLVLRDGGTRLHRITVVDSSRPAPEVKDPGRVDERHNVRLDFFFVQLNRKGDRGAGIRWPTQLGAGAFSGGFDFLARAALAPTTAVVSTALMPTLEMAESRGYAKVLRRASVITATGTRADFSSGGEVNIPIVNAVSAGFQSLDYGSKVVVAPRYDENTGRIELRVEASVSELDVSPGAEIPGRTTADLHTLVNMQLGQSLVLAGLSAHSETRARSGVPWLSQIPILGGLFGIHARRDERSENVIYIIPSLVEASSARMQEELERALDAYVAFDGGDPAVLRPGKGAP